jgi:hypothetical protein
MDHADRPNDTGEIINVVETNVKNWKFSRDDGLISAHL